MIRNLAVQTYPGFDAGIPEESTHWTLAELAEWKSIMDSLGIAPRDARWEKMLDYRAEKLQYYQYSSNRDLPADVVQELDLGLVACRAFFTSPATMLAAHTMAEVIATMRGRIPGTRREAIAVSNVLRTWNSPKALRGTRERHRRLWTVLPGGLCLNVDEEARRPMITLQWNGEAIGEVAATLEQLSDLRRFVSAWRTMCRNLLAVSLVPSLPCRPRLGDRMEFALPYEEPSHFGNAFVWSKTTPRMRPGPANELRCLLLTGSALDDQQERFELAGRLLKVLDRELPLHGHDGEISALNAKLAKLIRQRFGGAPIKRLRPEFIPVDDVLARVDETTRKRITATSNGKPVSLESDADTYIVHDAIWPQRTVRFKSLALAVDFERSNRDTKAMSVFAKAA